MIVQIKATRKILTLPFICTLLVVLLVACGNGGGSSSTTGKPSAASPDKQVFRDPVEGGDFDSLDPALTFSGLGDPYNIIYSNLMGLNDDGTVSDQLAASHTVSADGLTYTFTLKSAKFSDGTPITADDVAYSLNRVLLPATKSPVTGYLNLLKDYDQITNGKLPTLIGDSIIVKDPQTVQLVLSQPAGYFLASLAYATGDVVEKSLVEKYGATWIDHLAEGGTSGPFKVQSYGHTTALVLVPNPNYYGGFAPKLQKIVYTIATDRDSNYKAFQAHQYDVAPVPPALDDIAAKQAGYQHVSALASRFIEMNWLVKPLDNVHIRQALALAINRDLIIGNVVSKTIVTPSNHIVPNGMPGYNPALVGPAGVSSTAGDQTKAKALFAQGLQEEGLTPATFPSLTLNYVNSYKAGANTITAIVAEWKAVLGVTIKTSGESATQLNTDEANTIGKTSLQMWYGNWGADYADPQDWLSNFFAKGGQDNFANYGQNTSATAADQQAVQAKLAQADTDQNASERIKLYQEAEQTIVDQVGWFVTYQSSYVYSTNPKLQGWHLNALGSIATVDWANIYISQ